MAAPTMLQQIPDSTPWWLRLITAAVLGTSLAIAVIFMTSVAVRADPLGLALEAVLLFVAAVAVARIASSEGE